MLIRYKHIYIYIYTHYYYKYLGSFFFFRKHYLPPCTYILRRTAYKTRSICPDIRHDRYFWVVWEAKTRPAKWPIIRHDI